VLGGELFQFLPRLGGGDGIRERQSGLVIGAGLLSGWPRARWARPLAK